MNYYTCDTCSIDYEVQHREDAPTAALMDGRRIEVCPDCEHFLDNEDWAFFMRNGSKAAWQEIKNDQVCGSCRHTRIHHDDGKDACWAETACPCLRFREDGERIEVTRA